jgi:superfamily II DNA helicase RecQ
MAFKFFTISVQSPQVMESELNAFLRSHRVVAVERKWIEAGPGSCWAFCVDYLEARGDEPAARGRAGGGNRGRVDYREVLPAEEFAVFSRLRQWRKDVAREEAVPVYAVFTNEQLARMVRDRAATRADLEAIAGVGDARVEKFGPRVLDLLKQAWGGDGATVGAPV